MTKLINWAVKKPLGLATGADTQRSLIEIWSSLLSESIPKTHEVNQITSCGDNHYDDIIFLWAFLEHLQWVFHTMTEQSLQGSQVLWHMPGTTDTLEWEEAGFRTQS